MAIYRPWAFWRRVQYGAGVLAVLVLIGAGIYSKYIYAPPSCFDGVQNGTERGVDCGGACARVCAFDVREPVVQWSRAFRITDGFYNAVAYVENRNLTVGTPALNYTFSFYNESGDLITSRSGTTFLPPDSVYPIFEPRVAMGNQIPAETFLEIESIDNWTEASIGREQFEVRERTLSGVDNRPRLDTRIFNTLIQDEFDVEIVATIFDQNGNALTASRSVVPLLEAREEKSVVFTWPEAIAATLRSCEVPTDVVLAIDLSGSMNDDGGDPPEPVSSVLAAAANFVDRLKEKDQVAVVTFATHASLVEGLSNSLSTVQSTVEGLSIDPIDERGSTNTGDAIVFTHDEFKSPRHNSNARKVAVLLTDGLANAPGENAEAYALNAATTLKADDVAVFAIGLGESVNEEFVREMASSEAHAFFAAEPSTLDTIYRRISSAICEDGPAVIDIIPKTPGSLEVR